jgi:hypothetical protein
MLCKVEREAERSEYDRWICGGIWLVVEEIREEAEDWSEADRDAVEH